jgi:hypothetical protein
MSESGVDTLFFPKMRTLIYHCSWNLENYINIDDKL